MPPCRINIDACPRFLRLVKQLQKKHRQIKADLAKLFEEIERDYEIGANAAAITGWKGEAWKHRCASSDMQRGQSGGFRIISWVDKTQDPHVLYPMLIYAKSEREDATVIEVADAINSLKQELASLENQDDTASDSGADSSPLS